MDHGRILHYLWLSSADISTRLWRVRKAKASFQKMNKSFKILPSFVINRSCYFVSQKVLSLANPMHWLFLVSFVRWDEEKIPMEKMMWGKLKV